MIFLSYFANILLSPKIAEVILPQVVFPHSTKCNPSTSEWTGASFISATAVLRGTLIVFVVTKVCSFVSHSINPTLYVGFTKVPLIYALKYVLSSSEGAYTYHPSASYTVNELTYHSPGYVDESTSKVPSYNPVASFLVRLISLDDF